MRIVEGTHLDIKTVNLGILLLVLFCVSLARADQWPQFRGPDGNQLSTGQALPEVWGSETNIQWQVKIPGRAWSSPVVWEEKVFVTSVAVLDQPASKKIKPTDDCQWKIYCLNKDSGEIVLSLIHISEPTRPSKSSRMPSSA